MITWTITQILRRLHRVLSLRSLSKLVFSFASILGVTYVSLILIYMTGNEPTQMPGEFPTQSWELLSAGLLWTLWSVSDKLYLLACLKGANAFRVHASQGKPNHGTLCKRVWIGRQLMWRRHHTCSVIVGFCSAVLNLFRPVPFFIAGSHA